MKATFTMPPATSQKPIGDFLEEDVFPSLTAEAVFTHPIHQFQKARDKWRGDCPWHDSKSGTAFYVTPSTLQWNCPGCGFGGHVLQYLDRLNGGNGRPRGDDFIRVARQAAELAGVPFPERELTPDEQERARAASTRRDILQATIEISQDLYWSDDGRVARSYMEWDRGFSPAEQQALEYGLCPDAKQLQRQLTDRGFHPNDIKTAGIGILAGYVLIPWNDERGRRLTLYGRWPGDPPPGDKPKTKALPGEGSKRSPLYFDRVCQARQRQIVVVEGVLDAALAQVRGDQRVVACVGAQLSHGQVATLQRARIESVVICLDPDSAGANGIMSCIESLDGAGITAYVAPTLPDGLDPDRFIERHDIHAWREHLDGAIHAYKHKARQILSTSHNGAGWTDANKAAALKAARIFADAPTRKQRQDDLRVFFWPELELVLGGKPAAEAQEIEPDGISVNDFRAYMPEHKYIFVPSRELWPPSSVNARLGRIPTGDGDKDEPAAAWLDRNQPVEQMTWAPGEPLLIEGRLISNGGWIHRPGLTSFNLYRPPTLKLGDPAGAERWINHAHRIYPGEAEHIIRWLAQRVQQPGVKINHALVLGGQQGIGKDTLLEPVKYAIGPWNFQEVSPVQLLGRFNGFVKSVILRVSEARDLGDIDRYGFYEHLKVYTAAPPDVLRCDEKNVREYSVMNVSGVVITTNHKTDGIYLPADDRRHFVAWSEASMNDFDAAYWNDLYRWYEAEGYRNVAAYLAGLDLSDFDPKAPPVKTQAFWDVVDANRAPEDAELADALDALQIPDATTIESIASRATVDFAAWINERKNRRQIPHRMEAAGYVPVRNEAATDGLWKIGTRRQVIYARRELSIRERIVAAQNLTGR